MALEIKGVCRGRWPGLLATLGVPDDHLTGKHGPCPFCGGKDRFRFDDKDGEGTWICNQCGAGDGFSMLMRWHGWDFPETIKAVEGVVGKVNGTEVKQKPDPRPALRKVQQEAVPAEDVPDVKNYLQNRGLEVPPGLYAHPELAYYHEGKIRAYFPAMLGKVCSPENRPVTWHRTYLEDGQKADVPSPKKLMPTVGSMKGAAIRLYPANEVIAIAEGIETAIAVHMLWRVPAWAVISTAGMVNFIPPKGIKRVIICGDNDENYAGQAAAYEAGRRLYDQYQVDVEIPQNPGDWADVLWNYETTK